MKVIICGEESQEICIRARAKGHEAFSCDTKPCSGGHPEWHIQDNWRNVLRHGGDDWDVVIAHPSCTDLAVSGARWFKEKQADGRQQRAIQEFMFFTTLKTRCVCIENPICIMSSHYRKPDQIIQPWQFGHGETKATCLWLKNLPKLEPTNIVEGREQRIWKMPPGEKRAELRSKTYPGIAQAMVDQWM